MVVAPGDHVVRERKHQSTVPSGYTARNMKWIRRVRRYFFSHSLVKVNLIRQASIQDVHSSSKTRENNVLMPFEHERHGEVLTAGKMANLGTEVQPRCNRKVSTNP